MSSAAAFRQAAPPPAPTRPSKVLRTTWSTDPARPLPPSKIGPRRRKPPATAQPPPPPPAAVATVVYPTPLVVPAPARPAPSVSTAPMKHRLKTKSASEIYAAAEARRTQFHRKYSQHCRKYDIPYPAVGPRETEHLDTCHLCQKTWPLFLYEQHYVCKHSLDDVTRAWCDLPEFERARLHQMLTQADRVWLKSAIKSRSASSFQLFTKDMLATHAELKTVKDIQTRSARLAGLWRAQPPEVRQRYEALAEKAKAERISQLVNLPAFKKKQVDRARREYRRVLRESHPPKPPNPYLLFQQDAWQHESQKPQPLTYRDFVRLCSQRWKTELTPEQKQPYVDAAQVKRAEYFVRRDAATARVKAVRQQKRAAQAALASSTPAKVSRRGVVDQGSDAEDTVERCGVAVLPAGPVRFPRAVAPRSTAATAVPLSPAPTPVTTHTTGDEAHSPAVTLDDDEEVDEDEDPSASDDDDEEADEDEDDDAQL